MIEALRARAPTLGARARASARPRDQRLPARRQAPRRPARPASRSCASARWRSATWRLCVGRWPFGTQDDRSAAQDRRRSSGERACACSAKASGDDDVQATCSFGNVATLLDVELGTGRTHQIRVHAAHAGYPVAGDEKYGDRGEKDAAAGVRAARACSCTRRRSRSRGPVRVSHCMSAHRSPELAGGARRASTR